MASFNLDSLTVHARTLVEGEFGSLFRNGNIAAASSVALTTTGAATVQNGGAISSISESAVVAYGTGLFLQNTGIITGGTSAINVISEAEYNNVRIMTSGTINAASDGHAAISVDGHGAMIVNTGEIVSLGGHGISLTMAAYSPLTNTIFNGGSIYARGGGDIAILGSGARDDIENAGRVSGGIVTGMGGDKVVNSGTVTGTISLGNGNDIFEGRTGEVLGPVFGGLGNDTLRSGAAGEELQGEDGFDLLRGGTGSDTLDGGNDDDTIYGASGDDFLFGKNGHDEIWAGGGNDSVEGGRSGDLAIGGAGDDTLSGDKGSDTLKGGHGEDMLNGGEDADRLRGGRDADTLTGGPGNDIFVFGPSSGADHITDFTDGSDRISLVTFGLKGFGDLQTRFDLGEGSQGVRLDFGNGDVLVLEGVELEDLSRVDFQF